MPSQYLTYRQTFNMICSLVGYEIVDHSDVCSQVAPAGAAQLHLHSRLNTWPQGIGQRQLQDETRNMQVLGFWAPYTICFTIVLTNWQLSTKSHFSGFHFNKTNILSLQKCNSQNIMFQVAATLFGRYYNWFYFRYYDWFYFNSDSIAMYFGIDSWYSAVIFNYMVL